MLDHISLHRHSRATGMPLNTCTLGSVLLRGFTAHHSLALWPSLAGWLTRAWCQPVLGVTRTLEGCRNPIPPPESPLFTPRAPCLFLLILPNSFQVEILLADFSSMPGTSWLTAVSGKRNNQIIIQSWVFNSRKASGC